MNVRKLLPQEKVEVRQLEEGLRGAWYSGVVVGISDLCRDVKYDELLSDEGSSKLIESIPVTEAIEGTYQRPYVNSNYRGRIRPLPPVLEAGHGKSRLNFGVCIDALFEDAWWEGVIFDHNYDSEERSVFFPEEGDQRKIKVTDIRLTREWDEFSGIWRERGEWLLVKLAKEHQKDAPSQFIKRVWSRLKVNYGFKKMIVEWTCGAFHVWKKYFVEVVREMEAKTKQKGLGCPSTSQVTGVRDKGKTSDKNQHKDMHGFDLIGSSEKELGKRGSKAVSMTQGLGDSKLLVDPVSNPRCGDSCRSKLASAFLVHTARNLSFNALPRRKRRFIENKLNRRKFKPALTYKHKPRYVRRGSKGKQKVSDSVSSQVDDQCLQNRETSLLPTQTKSNLAGGFSKWGNGQRVGKALRDLGNVKCRKIRPTVPKRKLKDNPKTKGTSSKPQVSEPLQKDDALLDTCDRANPPTASAGDDSLNNALISSPKQRSKKARGGDSVCFVCQYGGKLHPCDGCRSSYHFTCLNLEAVPVGKWFCPCCRCGLCDSQYVAGDKRTLTEVCYQCSRQYHVDCLNKAGVSYSESSTSKTFCGKKCFEICARLHELLQIVSHTAVEGLTWTITRSRRNDCNIHEERFHPLIQPSQVLKVFHECFEPILEPHTNRDLVADVVYNSGSKLRRLDFHGFYMMVLLSGEEIASVATLRIHGSKVAELPLVATPFRFRRKGMCRLLVHEMEKMLIELGVERLVLPAISQLQETWVSSFGFTQMPAGLRQELLGYPFLLFQGTSLFQKVLCKSTLTASPSDASRATRNAEVAQENQDSLAGYDSDTKYGIFYKRKRRKRQGIPGKQNMIIVGRCGHPSALKYVYKRRRILAGRDSIVGH